ncbi:peptidylprolyl isomerase [Paenibacillus sp. N1-5-1-14]|uniref:peptidylprolyl isomerase n=1 Tax=Paenibacillus radicibacter TaxID=2972488 RepID=UPI0021590DD5|nr:peptidylprolyl isomerase [Paenibacillus radicibacter]MCR8641617.1 peptidylprolyl isomerase [Paenibacillus radicibacter]
MKTFRNRKRSLINALAIVSLVAVLAGCGQKNAAPSSAPTTPPPATEAPAKQGKQWDTPPQMAIKQDKKYEAVVKTNKGEFTIELFAKDAPQTVNNFVFLSKQNFYNDIVFHRIIKTFMIQTGDPKGNGTGGPGYKFKDELSKAHEYEPGIVAMANSGPNTNGSQFFICSGDDSTHLNSQPNYTIFGKVSKGMETITAIANTPVVMNPSSPDSSPSKPVDEIKIVSIEIVEK